MFCRLEMEGLRIGEGIVSKYARVLTMHFELTRRGA